jgi:hypothetical protein
MIHHLTYEVDKTLIAQEERFWGLLGFTHTGLRRRSRKQPPIHWLVCGDEGHAVELLPVGYRPPQSLGHVAYELDQRRWEIMALGLGGSMDIKYEEASPHFGQKRAFLHSPSGIVVEILLGRASVKAGPPLEEK